jgi:hypothetical protein
MTAAFNSTVWEHGRFDARRGTGKVLFGRMYEDTRIETGAFAKANRIFCIASAGCTAIALAAGHEVVAVDINAVQLAYAQRRFAGDRGGALNCGNFSIWRILCNRRLTGTACSIPDAFGRASMVFCHSPRCVPSMPPPSSISSRVTWER